MTTAVAYEAHRLADLIPTMTDAEFAELREDIAANGLLDPIMLYEDKILDGRHRYRACEETGVCPVFTQYEGDSPAAYVISHNLKRRSLNQSQKAMVASDFVPELAVEAKRRPHLRESPRDEHGHVMANAESEDSALGRSAARVAEQFGVGHAQVIRANKIKLEDPVLATRVRGGEVTIGAAIKQLAQQESAQQNGHKAALPSVDTGRGREHAQAHVRRLKECTGTLSGIARTFSELSIDHLAAASDQNELAALKKEIASHVKAISKFNAQLPKESA